MSCTSDINAWLDDPDDGDHVECCRERSATCYSKYGENVHSSYNPEEDYVRGLISGVVGCYQIDPMLHRLVHQESKN